MRAKQVFEFQRSDDPYNTLGIGKVANWKKTLTSHREELALIFDSHQKERELCLNFRAIFQAFMSDTRWVYNLHEFFTQKNLHKFKNLNDFIDYLNLDYDVLINGKGYDGKKLMSQILEIKIFVEKIKGVEDIMESANFNILAPLSNVFIKRLTKLLGKNRIVEYAREQGADTVFKIGIALNDPELQKESNIKTYFPVSSYINNDRSFKQKSSWSTKYKSGSILYHILKFLYENQEKNIRYTDLIKYIIEHKFDKKYDHTVDRGYWAVGIQYYVKSLYIYKSSAGYRITSKGIQKMNDLAKKFG